ncbi:MAG: TraE/TraK family type IV conjugative transfer system protein, partial [Usitatibacteraceae bacterium]
MDLGLSHTQSQRLLKQRNLLAMVAVLLFGATFLLTILAASRDREVVLQPILAKPLTLSSSGVPHDYLEMVTRDAA